MKTNSLHGEGLIVTLRDRSLRDGTNGHQDISTPNDRESEKSSLHAIAKASPETIVFESANRL
ncbi:hypothetical protein HPP92_004825 [Vanilla planifolia]|uniref:Uncharacterized protein n=1 Tax=Vanilla planifolia TaxID=51239 RepID=A0A835RSV0_VANPL|nr:hypothetical protein HPP92_004825 [Vanilla planifolia]